MKPRKRFPNELLVGVLAASALACQALGGSPALTPAGQASAPIAGAATSAPVTPGPAEPAVAPVVGGTATTAPTQPGAASAPILGGGQTPGSPAGSAPILGTSGGSALFQPVAGSAQPLRVVQVQPGMMASAPYYGLVVTVENPNTGVAIQDAQYQLTSYDQGGGVLDTAPSRIGLLFPGERRTLYVGLVASQAAPAKLEFSLGAPGTPVKTSLTADSLSTDRVKYWPDAGQVSGLVKNNSGALITMPLVTALFYDDQDQVIAASSDNFVGFVPPGDDVGVVLRVPAGLKPARVEFRAVPQGIWTVKAVPAGRPTLAVTQAQGFRTPQRDQGQAVFLAANSSGDRSLNALQTEVTAFDAAGDVVASVTGETPVVFPGDETAVVLQAFSVIPGAAIESTEVAVSPVIADRDLLDYHALGLDQNPLQTDASYVEQNFARVSVVVKNTWKNAVESATVTAVEFDAAGRIVGFGASSVGALAQGAQATASLDMVVATRAVPVRLVAYASISNPTAIH